MKYFFIPLILIGLVGSTIADSTIPSDTNSDTAFTAATFVDKYQDLLQKGGARVSVLIKVAGDVETTDPAKRAKEIRNLQSSVLKFLSFTNGINIISNPQKNEITGQIHPHWIKILEERSDILSVTILDRYELSKDGPIPAPLKQIKAGVALVDVICNEGKIPAYKYNAMRVACVSLDTESQLVLRGWALLRLQMYDDDPSRALCERYDGNWLEEHKECEYISPQQCSLMGGEFSECESACRHDPSAEICTLQCVLVCSIEVNHFPEFALSYTKEGGFAGITQNISIDTQDHLIKISGFDSKTLGPISTEDMQGLWDIISENQFFELDSTSYPPVEGSADYFTYTLDVVTSPQRNTISWTDTSSEFPKELVIITQEIDRQIQFYS